MVRALVILISTLLILLLLVAGSAWYLLRDEAFLKRQIEDAVQRETGRKLSIDGELVLEVGESIRFSADGVQFADAIWTKRDAMIEVGQITAQVDTRSLFSDRLDIDSLFIADCRLTLETNAAGDRNWDFETTLRKSNADDDPLAGLPVVLGRVNLENCQLEHIAPERIEPLNLLIGTLALQSDEQGQYSGEAAGLVNATEFRFSGRFGPPKALWQGGAFVQEVNLQLGEITLNSAGSFADARSGEGAQLDLRFSGPEFLQVARYLNLPPFSSGPFDAVARIDTTQQATLLSIDGDLGTLDLRAEGEVDRLRQPQRGRISLEAEGPDLQALAKVLGIEGMVQDSFRLNAEATFDGGKARLLPLKLDTPRDSLEVHGTLDRFPDLTGGDLAFKGSSEDVDRWADAWGGRQTKAGAVELEGKVLLGADHIGLKEVRIQALGDNAQLSGTIQLTEKFAGSQLEIGASIEELDRWVHFWGGQPTEIGAMRLDGKFRHGGNEIRLEDVQIVAGANRARVSGTVPLKKKFAGSQLDVQLQLVNAAATGSLLGVKNLPDLPLALTGPLEISADRITTPGLRLESGANRGEVSADIPRTPPFDDFTLAWQVSGDDLSRFFTVPGFENWPQDFASSGSWSRKGRADHLEGLKLQLGSLNLAVTGYLDGTSNSRRRQLEVQASLPDASKLEALWNRTFTAEPLEINAGLAGTWNDLQISGLSVALGATKIGGDLRFQRAAAAEGGEQNRISGSLRSDYLDASNWIEDAPASEEKKPDPRATSAKSSRMIFDDRPVMRFSKSPVDVDLDIKVASLDLGTSVLHDVRLGLLWTDQELRLDDVSLSDAQGARLSGHFLIDGREPLSKLDLSFRGKELLLGLAALEGQDPLTYPPLELVLDLQGAGKTAHELAMSLNGKIRMFQGSGLFGSARMGLLFNDFISELFNLLNPFAKQSEYSSLDCSVLAADVKSGLVTITPVIIQTPELTILSEGTIDLATERIDMTFNTKQRKGVGISAGMLINPFLKVGGRLAEPAIELDPKGAVISGGAAVATVGISLVFKSFADRFFSSKDPCGDARKTLDALDARK